MSLGRTVRALVKSNDRRFVELLTEQADLAVQCLGILQHFESGSNATIRDQVKEIERAGDDCRRILIDELVHTYATPWDREDLFALSRSIDDILDAADETAIELSLYRIEPPRDLHEIAGVLADGARHIRSGVSQLLHHPVIAAEHAVRAKRTENRVDHLYHQAVSDLFDSPLEIHEIFKAREIYRHLKNSADRIDHAADQISMMVIKRV